MSAEPIPTIGADTLRLAIDRGAAAATILLKGVAWWLTGSVGLLSDAIESFVNLAGALMALWMLTLAALPADDDHAYGYSKAEYFSSAFEGFLILLAAVSIGYAAIARLLQPQPLEAVGVGLMVSVLASVVNLATARTLMKVGKENNSITLEADAQHLMTDVWTSAGVIVGVGLVWLSGWLWLDPAIALLLLPQTSSGPPGSSCGVPSPVCWTPPCHRTGWRRSNPYWQCIVSRALIFMPCARASRAAAASSACTFWYQATGPCSRVTTASSRSRTRFASACCTRTSRPTWNHWKTPSQ
jgi:hypothetical protein